MLGQSAENNFANSTKRIENVEKKILICLMLWQSAVYIVKCCILYMSDVLLRVVMSLQMYG